MMFDQLGGYGYGQPVPYYPQPYQPVRQPVQPRPQPVAAKPKPTPKPLPEVVTAVRVPSPEQFGIKLDDSPVVVPTPNDLGIDLK